MFTAIIQARMGSTRLPKKTMMRIQNKPLLYYTIKQAQASTKISKIIIATTTLPEDQEIVDFAKSLGLKYYCGEPLDVLDRFYQCAKKFSIDNIVRVTPDDPFVDPCIIDNVIEKFETDNFDYVSNSISKENDVWNHNLNGFPYGLAVEVISFTALEQAWKNSTKPSEREHVSPYIINNPQLFKLDSIKNSQDFSDIRLTVDHKEDFDLAEKIINHFQSNEIFKMEKIVKFIRENPSLKKINSIYSFNEGYKKSLKEDDVC
jgi:spore coat polysaccharide biosynthesis protein SpsF (cytidylyltransferase family)